MVLFTLFKTITPLFILALLSVFSVSLLLINTSYSASNIPKEEKNSVSEKPALTKEMLGERLFFDPILSFNRQQSCSTCHDPGVAFIDSRKDKLGDRLETSIGADNTSIGDRNSPTITYAKFSPNFTWQTHNRFNSQQPNYTGFVGGQFWDGREIDLEGQAGGPPLNPVEMAMPDKASVVTRLKDDPFYLQAFQELFGEQVFYEVDKGYKALTIAIASFEKTPLFSPFDSKYDRVLRGEEDFSFKELSGKALFFSQQFTNCATCHQAKPNGHAQETFTNFEYHNIGVPSNAKLNKKLNSNKPDLGLFNNPLIRQEIFKQSAEQLAQHKGKFKVPTLRNIAVTAPYMHNGVFQDLSTVVQFYDHFLIGSNHKINPETKQPWAEAEVPETVAFTELKDGRKLRAIQVEQIVCFLRTLTDKRYEHLIEEKGIICKDPLVTKN